MNTRHNFDLCLKASLSVGVSMLSLWALPAVAQTADAASTQVLDEAGSTAQPEAAAADSIIVTGSRIRTDGMQAPVPVTVVSADSIEALSPGALITGLGQLPQFYGNQTAAAGAGVSFFNRSGYGSLNLRGLGVNRTLTLLNGRRMPSSSAYGGVDVNMFPEAMITNVEITTGGASAAYGSDAVAGVVNFTLDTNFTGLEVSAQGGITDRSDGENYELSATYGMDLGDRGHLIVSGEYFNQEGIFNYAGRDWYQAWGSINTGTATVPNYVFSPNVISSHTSFDGIILSPNAAINGLAFDNNGDVSPFLRGTTTQGAIGATGARHVDGPGLSGDDTGAEVNTLVPDLQRYSVFAYADYELSDNTTVFAQFIHGRTKTFQYSTPRGGFHGINSVLTIFSGNPYLPDSLQQTMTDNNIASFTMRRFGSLEDIGRVSLEDQTTQNIGTVGLSSELETSGMFDGWNVEAYYQYGHSVRDWRQTGVRLDRIYAALDVVEDVNGNPVCRVSLDPEGAAAFPGCQPLNLFGRGNASEAAIDYVLGSEAGQAVTTPIYYAGIGYNGDEMSYVTSETKNNITTFTQNFAEASASGEVFDGWAGPVSMAVGGSYRRDHIRQLVQDVTNPTGDPAFRPVLCNSAALGLRGVTNADCTNNVGVQNSRVSNILGTSSVWEAFGELLFPLVDAEGFNITANGAVRWADYSGSGTVWAYKGGVEIGIADQVRLRGTYSRDVRAPNLAERFDQTGGIASVVDPRYPADGSVPVSRLSGGNPSVRPEKADTMTLGVVMQPDWAPGLSASIDYYHIKISDAISQAGNQVVLDRCEIEDAQEFCDLITRDPTTDRITQIRDIFVNVAESQVSGLDAEISYGLFDVFAGEDTLSARLFTSWLFERSETTAPTLANPDGVTSDLVGQVGARQSDGLFFPYADFKATANLNYSVGGVSAMVQGRYIGSGLHDACGEAGRCATLVSIADNRVEDVLYIDLRLGYAFELAGAEAEVFGNITNLFDKDPPVTPSYNNFLAQSTQHNIALYDVMGRRYTAGVKLRF